MLILDVGVIIVWFAADWGMEMTIGDLGFKGDIFIWLGLLYACTFATLYPYNAYSYATTVLNPSITTVYCTWQPVGTIVLSYLILQEVVTLPQGLGALLVIGGLMITICAQRSKSEVPIRRRKKGGSDDSDGPLLWDDFESRSSHDRTLGRSEEEDNFARSLLSESNLSALHGHSHLNGSSHKSGDDDALTEKTDKTVAWQTSQGRTMSRY